MIGGGATNQLMFTILSLKVFPNSTKVVHLVHVGNSWARMQGIVGNSYKNSVIFQFGGGTSLIPRFHSSSQLERSLGMRLG